jgi:hypothetical protein
MSSGIRVLDKGYTDSLRKHSTKAGKFQPSGLILGIKLERCRPTFSVPFSELLY